MARRVRDWREADHPRWPPGSGDKSGEFRDKSGGDWVDRLGDALPAGRYGSISTGQTHQCPFCGRAVKIVGTSGKLSTHNSRPGQRCEGSGGTVGPDGLKAGDLRSRRAKKPPKNKEIKAPDRPQITPGAPKDRIDYDIARARFRRWQDGAAAPATKMEQYGKSRREWEIENTEKEIKQNLAPALDYAQARVRRDLVDEIRRAGEDPDSMRVREDWSWNDSIKWRTEHEQRALDQALDYLKALRENTPIADQQGVRLGIGGYPRKQWTTDQLDEFVPAGSRSVPAQSYDPAHPLDVYGDLLRIHDDSWFTYQALDTLEQDVPPIYHEVVAAHLAGKRGVPGSGTRAGIFVGAVPVPDLDHLAHLRGTRPRGWHKGRTWQDVDGVVSGASVLAVGYTPNTESGRATNIRVFSRPDDPNAGRRLDPSAMGHEFGHMLDAALGGKPRTGGVGQYRAASEERQWRLIHGKVIRRAGRFLNPYFKQKGSAGPEEMWADAFGVWAQASDDPITGSSYTPGGYGQVPVEIPGGGSPLTYVASYVLPPGVKKTPGVAQTWQEVRAPVTRRIAALAGMYDVDYSTAAEMNDYFNRLHKEVQSGKRKTQLQSRGY